MRRKPFERRKKNTFHSDNFEKCVLGYRMFRSGRGLCWVKWRCINITTSSHRTRCGFYTTHNEVRSTAWAHDPFSVASDFVVFPFRMIYSFGLSLHLRLSFLLAFVFHAFSSEVDCSGSGVALLLRVLWADSRGRGASLASVPQPVQITKKLGQSFRILGGRYMPVQECAPSVRVDHCDGFS